MNENFSKVKKIILIVMIILVIIFIGYKFLYKDNVDIENANILSEENKIRLTQVTDIKDMYNIEKCINKYLDGIETDSKLLKDINLENEDDFYIKDAYIIEANSKNTIYLIKGNIINLEVDNKIKKEKKLTLIVDNENKTFEISLFSDKFANIINYNNEIAETTFNQQEIMKINENIEYKSFNYYYFENTTDEQLARRLYEDFKINILYFPKELYEIMDKEYKKERFSTYESFEQYLKKIKTNIAENTLSKYSVDKIDEGIQYTLVDTYQNTYILKTKKNSMEYTVFLDNYTVKSDGFEERYNYSNEQNKVSTNVNIFISMINTYDYSHAYKLLDETFKNNNFRTEEQFEKYIQEKFFEHNIMNIKNIREQGSYYICEARLRNNNSSASDVKELTIIMKLKEGTDFVMSFNIK